MKNSAITQMTREHRLIAKVVGSLQAAATALESNSPADCARLRGAIEFLRVYADQRHHQREEAIFFPVLIKRGVPPQGCPLGGLTHDHAKGRELVNTLEQALTTHEQNPTAPTDALRQALADVVKLYRHHLWMEDAMVFPMAKKVVTAADDQELTGKFADLDRIIGAATVSRLETFAAALPAVA